MTDLRDLIARALHRQATDDGEVHVLWGGVSQHEEEVAEWLPFADAVLAVLADLPDDVIEQAAKGIDPDAFTMTRDEYRSLYGAFPAGARMTAKGEVKAAFRAAFGGEQA